ncbi:MAG: hypothetical protein QF437_15490 [Planctomycetota bacterium]|jgi:hypothetical protein|nr:hypothetical protein [Planctomycetota bacterium]
MSKKVLFVIDLLAFSVIGALAGQIWMIRGAHHVEDLHDLMQAGAVIGAVLAGFIGLEVFTPDMPRETGWIKKRLAMILLSILGAVIGVRSMFFILAWPIEAYEKVYIHEDEEDDPQATVGAIEPAEVPARPDGFHFKRAHLHFLSLTLMLGLALTHISGSLFLKVKFPDFSGSSPGIIGILLCGPLPLACLSLIVTGYSLPGPVTSVLAVMGVFWGWMSGGAIFKWQKAPLAEYRTLPGQRAKGLLAMAAGLASLHYIFLYQLDKGPRHAVTAMLIIALSSVGGILFGAVIAGLGGGSLPERRFLSPMWSFSGGRCATVMILVTAGAIVGQFGCRVSTLYIFGISKDNPYPGALIGGLIALVLLTREERNIPMDSGLEEAIALFSSYIKLALPLGLVFFLGATFYFKDLQSQESLILAVCFGPLVGGTFGMFWRASRMYAIRTAQEWFALAWGCGVATFFGFYQQEVLMNLLYTELVIPCASLMGAGVLVLLAAIEFFVGGETEPPEREDPFGALTSTNGKHVKDG